MTFDALLENYLAVFLFPWAVNVAGATPTVFWEMVIFIGILAAGLGYAWKKGVLQWSKQ